MWKWTNECQLEFEKLKMVLVEDVTLAFADFEKQFFLEVDACKTGHGAVLHQLDDNQKRRSLAYASRKNIQNITGIQHSQVKVSLTEVDCMLEIPRVFVQRS